jgi:hypothetical protein
VTVGDGAKYKTAHQYRIDRRTGTLRISESRSFASENTLAANKHKAECPAATKNSSIPKQKCENMMRNCIYSYSKTGSATSKLNICLAKTNIKVVLIPWNKYIWMIHKIVFPTSQKKTQFVFIADSNWLNIFRKIRLEKLYSILWYTQFLILKMLVIKSCILNYYQWNKTYIYIYVVL